MSDIGVRILCDIKASALTFSLLRIQKYIYVAIATTIRHSTLLAHILPHHG